MRLIEQLIVGVDADEVKKSRLAIPTCKVPHTRSRCPKSSYDIHRVIEKISCVGGLLHARLHIWMLNYTRSDLDGIPYLPVGMVVCIREQPKQSL